MQCLSALLLLLVPLLTGACLEPPAPTAATGTSTRSDAAPSTLHASHPGDPIVVSGLATPESALHDEVADVYLVSNINGHPLAADNNGFISRIAPDGSVLALRWIEGGVGGVTLHGPKGMVLIDDVLHVADIDGVRLFDRESGAPLGFWPVTGTLLNDVCADDRGTIYITDTGLHISPEGEISATGSDAIHRFVNGAAQPLVTGASLKNPNGCTVIGANVYAVSFSSSEVYRVNPSGRLFTVATLPTGGLDGILRIRGTFYVTSWEGSQVLRMAIGGTNISSVLTGLGNPADLGYDAKRNRLLVPVFAEDRLLIQPLE